MASPKFLLFACLTSFCVAGSTFVYQQELSNRKQVQIDTLTNKKLLNYSAIQVPGTMVGSSLKAEDITLNREDYLQFFKETLDYYNKDFPERIIDRETSTRISGLNILLSGNIIRMAAVEATMFEFTGEKDYQNYANQVLEAVVSGINNTPNELWEFIEYKTPEGNEKARIAYQNVPKEATWFGRPWWHLGAFYLPLPLATTCKSLNQSNGWKSRLLKDKTEDALARIVDYHVFGDSRYKGMRGATHNIAMTLARGIYMTCLLLPDHPHVEQWRQWALETFQQNINRSSQEDASNYELDWFYSVLTVASFLSKGKEVYYLPHHRSYFEHFKEMVAPSGVCVGYGDSGDYGNAALLPVLEKGASVFHDGTYKHAALRHFMAINNLPLDNKYYYLQTTRWFEAYRWMDESVRPEAPQPGVRITHKGMSVLRTGTGPNQVYLSLTSLEGGGHGHFDANAIAHYSIGKSGLLQDGNYQWEQAFFHNRLLWREGVPSGKLLDYLRPKKNPAYPSKDSKKIVFASEGSPKGVEDRWHPAEEKHMSIKFWADLSEFKVVRSVLGPQERTILLDRDGRCFVFDYLKSDTSTTAASLYYTPEIVEKGSWWVLGTGSPESSLYNLLITSLEPRELNSESQVRRHTSEQVVYSSKTGHFKRGTWFVTGLIPKEKSENCMNLSETSRLKHIIDGETTARELTVNFKSSPIKIICRGSDKTGLLHYSPIDLNRTSFISTIKTDADLIYFGPFAKGIKVGMVNGTLLEVNGKKVISLPSNGNEWVIIPEE